MAIGSAPEIGVEFRTGRSAMDDWMNGGSKAWRLEVGDDGVGGYGTIAYPPRGADNPHSRQDLPS